MNEPTNTVPSARDRPKKGRGGSTGKGILICAAAILLILLAVILLHQFGVIRYPWDATPAPVANVSGSIKQGTPGMTHEEILAAMQEDADNSNVRIVINARPEFEDGTSEGLLYIVNSIENAYPMKVNIYLDETDELIYESGLMEPNTYIDNDKLKVALSKGEYEATAHILFYDPDNPDDPVSRSTASLIITIKN